MTLEDCLKGTTGIVVMGASNIRLSDDPEYPVIVIAADGSERKLHKSRVVRLPGTPIAKIEAGQ